MAPDSIGNLCSYKNTCGNVKISKCIKLKLEQNPNIEQCVDMYNTKNIHTYVDKFL